MCVCLCLYAVQSSPTECLYKWIYRFHSGQNVFDEYFENVKSFAFVRPKWFVCKDVCSDVFLVDETASFFFLFFWFGLSNVSFFSSFLPFSNFQWKSSESKVFVCFFAFRSFECLLQQSAKIWPFIKTYDVGNCLIKLFIWIQSFGCFPILKNYLRFCQRISYVFFCVDLLSFAMCFGKIHRRTSFSYKIEQRKKKHQFDNNLVTSLGVLSKLSVERQLISGITAFSQSQWIMPNEKLPPSNCWFRVQSPSLFSKLKELKV